ncbi:MAG: hypothetical protein GX592_01380, partial [Clostridiales bacterium]|nr:hypothetical protein [Clostridiales bacterium]
MDIDFAITWVDGSDPAWLAQKATYDPSTQTGNEDLRFRDWENLQYWFRGVEKFAPWVRRVHLITWGHLPPWLNTGHPKLNIVRHEDYIPEQYLPTFSSRPIELNMHRIEGLSDHFVSFNDDMFITAPVSPEDFFAGGLPTDRAGLTILRKRVPGDLFFSAMTNNLMVLNRHFCSKDVYRHPRRWFSRKNGARNIRHTLYLSLWPHIVGLQNEHLPISFEKRTFSEVWAAEPDVLDQTCRSRFRRHDNINIFLMRDWRNLKGQFVPRG